MAPTAAARLLAISLALGVLAQYLFVRQLVGLNVLAALAAMLASAWWSRPRDVAIAWRDAWIPLAALAFGALCAIRVDVPLVAFDLVAAVVLVMGSILVLGGIAVSDLALPALVATAANVVVGSLSGAGAVARIGAPVLAARAPSRSSRGTAQAGGVALAVPFIVLFGALFSSADAVFRHLVESAIDLEALRRLYVELPGRVVFAVAAAWLVGGWLSRLRVPRATAESGDAGRVGAATAATMLLLIDVLFATFVAIQVAYLFGGRDTLDASGVPYSTYGRAGFFELVAVAGVVATLLFVLDLQIERRARAYITAALALIALTGVVLASAWSRMSLYQDAYGWSELRFYAFAGIAYTAVALLVIAWSIARGRMAFALQRLVLAAAIVALAVNAIGPSALVARRDLDRVIDPSTLPSDASRGLDLGYLMSLGDGALPTIAALSPALPEPERSAVLEALRIASLHRAALPGWQSLNWDREAARTTVIRANGNGAEFLR